MFRKLIIWLAITTILLAGGLVLVTEVVLSPKRLTGLVQPYLSAQLGRQVSLERVELSLFSGIRVQTLKIMDDPAFSQEEFVTFSGLEIDFTPLSLLTGSVDRIVLTKPLIRLIRDQDGRFNFQGLMKSLFRLARKFPLKVSAAAVDQGRVTILDQKSGERIVLEGIRIQGRDISLKEPFPFSLNLKANGAELILIGREPVMNQEGQVKLLLKPFDLKALSSFLPARLGLVPQKGVVSSQMVLEGFSFEEMRASGRFVVDKLDLMTSQGLKSGLSAQADLDLSYDFKNLRTDIRALDLKLGTNRLVASGRLDPKSIELDLKLPEQSWGELAGLFSRSGKNLPPGKISAELTARSENSRAGVEISGGFKIFELTRPEAKTEPLDHQGKLKAFYLPGSSKFVLDHLEIRGPALELTAQGGYENQNLTLNVPDLKSDLGLLARVLPAPAGLRISGSVKGGLELKGDPAERGSLAALAHLTLDDIGLISPDLPGPLKLSGNIRVKDQEMTDLNLTGKIQGTTFKVNGQGANILTRPELRLDIRADQANLTRLLGPSVKKALGLAKSQGGKLKIPAAITAQGRVNVKNLKLSIVPMRNFGTDYLLRNSVLTFKPLDPAKWKGSTLSSVVSLSLGD